MKIYLHGDAAERAASYTVTIAPAADEQFLSDEKMAKHESWEHKDGTPKQFPIVFCYGAAEVADHQGNYMVARGIAKRHRMIRKVRQIFDRRGKPIEEVFDEVGNRIFLEGQSA